MSRILGVAAVQAAPVAADPEATFAKFAREVRSLAAVSPAMDLLVFPELYLTGLGSFDTAHRPGYLERVAETIPGPLTDAVCELAAQTGKWIVPGSLSERNGSDLHNTAIAISPSGEIVASYRKLFPWTPYETSKPGDRHVTFDIPGVGRFGLAICYTGRSIAVDPEGRVLAEAGDGEEFLTFLIDLDLVTAVREHGTAGLNAIGKQLRDAPPPFPPFADGYAAGEVMRELGPLLPRDDGNPVTP